MTTTGGNSGGGLISAGVPGLEMHPEPFAPYGNLRAMAEHLRSFNWPIDGSLQEVSESDPGNESVLDLLPVITPLEAVTTVTDDGADH